MNPRFAQLLSTGLIAALLALSACSKQAEAPQATASKPDTPKPVAIEVVKENERSRNFLVVSKQLELGGPLYGYVDVDGDVLKLAGNLKGMVEQLAKMQPEVAPYLKQD